jgi:hypothetical protein
MIAQCVCEVDAPVVSGSAVVAEVPFRDGFHSIGTFASLELRGPSLPARRCPPVAAASTHPAAVLMHCFHSHSLINATLRHSASVLLLSCLTRPLHPPCCWFGRLHCWFALWASSHSLISGSSTLLTLPDTRCTSPACPLGGSSRLLPFIHPALSASTLYQFPITQNYSSPRQSPSLPLSVAHFLASPRLSHLLSTTATKYPGHSFALTRALPLPHTCASSNRAVALSMATRT